jgi:hypothetical protein
MDRLRACATDSSAALKVSEGKVSELQEGIRKTKAQLADALSELDIAQHEIVPLRKCGSQPLLFLHDVRLTYLPNLRVRVARNPDCVEH